MTNPVELVAGKEFAGHVHHTPAGASGHVVQFYENDDFLAAAVADYLAEGLAHGDNVAIIATEGHRQAFTTRLRARGIDVERAMRMGQFVQLDAPDTLRMFMRGGMPDAPAFYETIGAVLHSLRTRDASARIRLYGEMVDVLWKEGNTEGAIRLEELWNSLGAQQEFQLFCAYAMGHFYKTSGAQGL
ncbi:MAG TPA: MEDS domain-containing protein, partial [Gemmatimonadaceae bacterium]|nr:MEDS domain-containing protein [Gemmatimonadaceae bacterium]